MFGPRASYATNDKHSSKRALPNKYIWNTDSDTKFKTALASNSTTRLINEFEKAVITEKKNVEN